MAQQPQKERKRERRETVNIHEQRPEYLLTTVEDSVTLNFGNSLLASPTQEAGSCKRFQDNSNHSFVLRQTEAVTSLKKKPYPVPLLQGTATMAVTTITRTRTGIGGAAAVATGIGT
jgi:hypothetical protein